MTVDESLRAQFYCPKCRSRDCHVERVNISGGVLHLRTGRYRATTCALCGYTEFWDEAVVARSLEHHEAEATAPETS